jgi:HAD superfamily hydrolase (TIGR01484 family)
MRYHALACDYDGTLAHDGRVSEPTWGALDRLRATGRRLILVTGRELADLHTVAPDLSRFDWVVAENGALLYRPATREEKLLGPPLPPVFIERLKKHGVSPLSVGRVIAATRYPYETFVLKLIRELGLELHVVFNKGAVMVLPATVNKATGLKAALKSLGLSAHEIVGVGDAENDHAFLSMCECAVAVANALPAVKEHADLVTAGDHGAGVVELIEQLIQADLSPLDARLIRHYLPLGIDRQNKPVSISSYGPNVLIAGPSGSGKSSVAKGLLDRLADQRYQFCIIDPEGDYEALEGAVTLGDNERGPGIPEVLQILADPTHNVVVNLVGLPLGDRPSFFLGLLPRLRELRARTGRPHWLIVDEAHHLLPTSWEPGSSGFTQDLNRTVFITVHSDQVAPIVLTSVGTVIAVGAAPEETIGRFCRAAHEPVPGTAEFRTESGEALFWVKGQHPLPLRVTPSKAEHRRHTRKYAEGELPPDRSFYFRGPADKLNLRAQNFSLFMQLGDGVDDATWLFHLRRGDYARWIREQIRDEKLADEVQAIETRHLGSAAESRKLVRQAIERRYTLPASSSTPAS